MPSFDPILGRDDILAEENFTKGTLVRARRRYVEETFGAEGVAEVRKMLSGAALENFDDPPPPAGWFPYAIVREIDKAIAIGPFGGDISKMQAFGAKIASYDLTTLYRVFFKISSPSFVVARMGLVAKSYFREGELKIFDTRKNATSASLAGGGHPLYMCQYGFSGYMESAVLLSGGSNVQTQHVKCRHRGDEACIYEVSWA